MIRSKSQVSYLCIGIKPDKREQYNIQAGGLIYRVARAFGGDFDLVFNDQEFSMNVQR